MTCYFTINTDMDTDKLAKIMLFSLKQLVNSFAKEIGEEVTCQRCRRIERDYDLVPKKREGSRQER